MPPASEAHVKAEVAKLKIEIIAKFAAVDTRLRDMKQAAAAKETKKTR